MNLHHRTYKRIGEERVNDLRWLCRGCHQLAHILVSNGIDLNNAHDELRFYFKCFLFERIAMVQENRNDFHSWAKGIIR